MNHLVVRRRRRRTAALALSGALGGLLVLCSAQVAAADTSVPYSYQVRGTFHLAAGSCTGSVVAGSWLQELAIEDAAVRNPSSGCLGGAYTPLTPGSVGLSTEAFAAPANYDFDAAGNSVDAAIASPTAFGPHRFGLATADADIQDDPSGPALYQPPAVELTGASLTADLRSLYVSYGGAPQTSCATGQGCWQQGTRTATGTLDRRTGAFTLDWTTGQGFVPGAAASRFHFEGTFTGTLVPVGGGAPVAVGATAAATDAAGAGSGVVGVGRHGAPAGATRVDSARSRLARPPTGGGGAGPPGGSRGWPGLAAAVLLVAVGVAAGRRAGKALNNHQRATATGAARTQSGRARRWPLVAALVGATAALSACGGGSAGTGPHVLSGRLLLAPGICAGPTATPTGSWLEVVDEADNKVITNPQGGCTNTRFTPLRPGRDGGLLLGHFQPDPSPTFDGSGNSRAGRIVAPVAFGPSRLGLAADARDEQDAPTGAAAFPAPSATATGSHLTADLRALNFTYQGPAGQSCSSSAGVGCYQLGSRSASGTYDSRTRRFTLQWFVGESFTPQGDSMIVHLAGTLSSTGPAPTAAGAQDAAVVAQLSPVIDGVPAALTELPVAMAATARPGTQPPTSAQVSAASQLLRSRSDLSELAAAVRAPRPFIAPLQEAMSWLARRGDDDGATPPAGLSESSLAGCLDRLQTVYEEVVPALRLSAATVGRPSSAADVMALVESRPQLADLYRFVTHLDQLYGAGVVAERALS